jgi:toxin ParE1/3/4
MIFSIHFSAQTEADLRGIFEYIAYELQAFQNAAGQLRRLEEAIYSLNQMPERFRQYEKEPWHSRGLRVMPLDNYLIFYIPNKSTQTVDIVRIMYGGRNTAEQLNTHTQI